MAKKKGAGLGGMRLKNLWQQTATWKYCHNWSRSSVSWLTRFIQFRNTGSIAGQINIKFKQLQKNPLCLELQPTGATALKTRSFDVFILTQATGGRLLQRRFANTTF